MRRVIARRAAVCVISIYLDEKIFPEIPKRFRKETGDPILKDMRIRPSAVHGQTADNRHRRPRSSKAAAGALNSPVAEVRRVFTDPDRTVIYLGRSHLSRRFHSASTWILPLNAPHPGLTTSRMRGDLHLEATNVGEGMPVPREVLARSDRHDPIRGLF